MREIVLSISMLTPGGEYLEACLEALNVVRSKVACELVIVDTGCNAEYRALIKKYADLIVPFTWCDDFSAARNAGLEKCSGEWFLYLDDDEVLEDCDKLLEFIQSPENKQYAYAFLELNNYIHDEGNAETSSYVARLFRRTDDMRFIYPVHEGIPISKEMCGIKLDVTLGHYGYFFRDREALLKHSERNITLLQKAMEDYPDTAHLASQLAHEYQIIDDYEKQIAVCERYFGIAERGSEDCAILACGWLAGLIGFGQYEQVLSLVEGFRRELSDCKPALATIYTYELIAFYHLGNYHEMVSTSKAYEDAYQGALLENESLNYEFFVRNGLNDNYRSLIVQMIICAGLRLLDENAIVYYQEKIQWEGLQLKLYDDFPKVLCEVIEGSRYTPLIAKFLEEILHVDVVKNAVLKHKMQLLTE